VQLSMHVNGQPVEIAVATNRLLSQCLREDLTLTGTHIGCDTAQCCPCSVLIAGGALKSCNVLAALCQGAAITRIEGLSAPDGALHPVQEAFRDCHALQCGFCTPGMIMSVVDLCARRGSSVRRRGARRLERARRRPILARGKVRHVGDHRLPRRRNVVNAQIGGNIAQVGQRLIDGVACKMADDFFARFETTVVQRRPVAAL
jgi:carbon-monoxide dehydrogenase small subunit